MSIEDLLKQRAEAERADEEEQTKLEKQQAAEIASKIKIIAPHMKIAYNIFLEACEQLKKSGYCSTLKVFTTASENIHVINHIFLGGVWKERPAKPCAEMEVNQMRIGDYVECGISSDCEKITFLTVIRRNQSRHTCVPDTLTPELVEKYIEEYLSQVI